MGLRPKAARIGNYLVLKHIDLTDGNWRTALRPIVDDRTVTGLELRNSTFGPTTLKHICDFLLTKPDFFGLDLRSNSIGPQEIAPVIRFIEQAPKLRELDLGDNEIDDFSMVRIAFAMTFSRQLQTVGLDQNAFSDLGASAVAECARRSRTLRSLDLSGNDISNRGHAYLKEAVHENPRVGILSKTYEAATESSLREPSGSSWTKSATGCRSDDSPRR